MKLLLWALEKLGRYEVLVDAFGKVYWRRYYLFYRDRMENPRWIDYLPNIHLNIFESEDAENEDEHNHPWSTISVMLRGSYTESINHSTLRETKAPGLAILSYKDSHRLAKMTAGTVTLFMHGFRRGEWKFDVRQHTVVCDFCQKNNGGVCAKKTEVLNYDQYVTRGDGPNTSFGKTRTVTWRTVDKEFRKQLDRRRSAIWRLNVSAPKTKDAAKDAVKAIALQRQK